MNDGDNEPCAEELDELMRDSSLEDKDDDNCVIDVYRPPMERYSQLAVQLLGDGRGGIAAREKEFRFFLAQVPPKSLPGVCDTLCTLCQNLGEKDRDVVLKFMGEVSVRLAYAEASKKAKKTNMKLLLIEGRARRSGLCTYKKKQRSGAYRVCGGSLPEGSLKGLCSECRRRRKTLKEKVDCENLSRSDLKNPNLWDLRKE